MDLLGALGLRKSSFVERKTVTFGDESAVVSNRLASIISVLSIFLLWGVFTGSKWSPIHAPAPFVGTTEFTYTVKNEAGETDTAKVSVAVVPRGTAPPKKPDAGDTSGLAVEDFRATNVRISASVRVLSNDANKGKGLTIVAVNDQPIATRGQLSVDNGVVVLTPGKTLLFKPNLGWQTDPIYLPPPEAVVDRFIEIWGSGYRNSTLGEHVGYSLFRVIVGFLAGSLVGIPLGFAMGLNSWVRGWFDPIVEFMRPVPPLALIPLVIIWAGIGETAKIILLFLAALWIMAIGARAGVSGVSIQKVHAAYSLGASKWQILTRVIFPNALPEIFTAARVAMGVCWGTVVAAELVAAEKGSGMMIMVASKFQLTDIVIMGIIVIGVIGYSIDILMRRLERWLVPWKGRS
ncbi:MAG: ABC transporter permease [Hyphomicrobiaceae bacterium]